MNSETVSYIHFPQRPRNVKAVLKYEAIWVIFIMIYFINDCDSNITVYNANSSQNRGSEQGTAKARFC